MKGLKKENLRDNMTNTELILNMLAEASTKDISVATNPKDYDENKEVAKQGGNVAKVALKELESKTGKDVVTSLNAKNFLPSKKENKKLKYAVQLVIAAKTNHPGNPPSDGILLLCLNISKAILGIRKMALRKYLHTASRRRC